MGELLALLIFLGLFTVTGHGIWVFVAFVLRQLSGGGPEPKDEVVSLRLPRPQPPRQAAPAEPPNAGAQSQPLSDLRATARQLDRFRQTGTIDDATHARLMSAVEAEQRRLTAPPASAPIPVRPPAPPPPAPPKPSTDAPRVSRPVVLRSEQDSRAESQRPRPAPPKAPSRPVAPPAPPVRAARAPEPVAAPPRKSFAELLAAFMEEKNIRWGELVGGLLIIGCSAALVVSLWAQIEQIPLLKFFVFTAMTGALAGLGFYSESRWKLPRTSRGLLVTAAALVPLNFLAVAAFTDADAPNSLSVIASELASLAFFLLLAHRAGAVILPGWKNHLVVGVVGASATQLLVRRLAGPEMTLSGLYALAALPLACYWMAAGLALSRLRGRREVKAEEARQIITLIGLSTFAAFVACGLLFFKSGHAASALQRAAPLVSLFGVPALAAGLTLWRRMSAEAGAGDESVTSATVAAGGAVLLLAGVALGWPQPAAALPSALVCCAALTAAALLFDVALAHAAALPCFVLASTLGYHAATGRVEWHAADAPSIWRALISTATGLALTCVFLLLVLVWEALKRRGRGLDAFIYFAAVGAVGALSLLLVTPGGFGEAGGVWAYGLYAGGAFYLARRTGRAALSAAGLALSLGALIQVVVFRFGAAFAHPWPLTLLVYASLALVCLALISRSAARQAGEAKAETRRLFVAPLKHAALAVSIIAVLPLLAASPSMRALMTLWLAALWLALVWVYRSAALFTPFQAALTAGVAFAATAIFDRAGWLVGGPFDARRIQAQTVAVVLLSLGWVVLRIVMRRFGVSRERVRALEAAAEENGDVADAASWRDVAAHVMYPPWPALDQAALWASLGLFTLLSVAAVWPGVVREHSPGAGGAELLTPAPSLIAWLLLAALAVTFAAELWERFSRAAVLALVLLGAAACLLVAQSSGAAASALRWTAALYSLAGSCVIWLREPVARRLARFDWPEREQRAPGLTATARALLLALTAAPLVVLTLHAAATQIIRGALAGPLPDSVFAHLSAGASYLVPLLLLCGVLVGHALRERESAYAFAGGLTLNLAATLGYALATLTAGGAMGAAQTVRLLQLNAAVCAGYALVWLAARGRLTPGREAGGVTLLRRRASSGAKSSSFDEVSAPPLGGLLKLQAAVGLALNLLVLAPAAVRLFAGPQAVGDVVIAAGGVWGWLALALAGIAAAWARRLEGAKLRLNVVCAGALAAGLLAACAVGRWDAGDWLSFRTLLASSVAAAFLPVLALWIKRAWLESATAAKFGAVNFGAVGRWAAFVNSVHAAEVTRLATVLGLLSLLLAARALGGNAWWTVGALAALSLLAAALAGVARSRAYFYAAGLLLNSAVTVAHLFSAGAAGLRLVEVNVITLAATGLVFFGLEKWLAESRGVSLSTDLPSFHHAAAVVSLISLAGLVIVGLARDLAMTPAMTSSATMARGLLGSATGWGAVLATAALMLACLYDRAARLAPVGLYLLSLTLTGAALDWMTIAPERFLWVSLMICAAWSVATSLLWSGRLRLAAWAESVGVPHRAEFDADPDSATVGNHWLVTANLLFIAAAVLLALVAVFSEGDFGVRLAAALAALIQVLPAVLLARGESQSGARRALALWLLAAGLTLCGWSFITPDSPGGLVNRAAVLMAVTMTMAEVCGFWRKRLFARSAQWREAAEACAAPLFRCGALALGVIFVLEILVGFLDGGTSTTGASLAASLALLALGARGLSFALRPALDPLRLSERERMNYVYAAEALLAAAFIHTRLTLPWLFGGFFQRHWPLAVLALAFIGVGLGEVFRRRGRGVLAEPLHNTGVFLPLLPALGYWVADSEVHYTGVMLLVGLLYAAEGVVRRSLGASLLACLAANGGLWYWLAELDGYSLLERPQLWLSPLALSVLAAAHLNRERLSAERMTNVRYAALTALYVSSTAEIFIGGVAESPWQPLVLMTLSAAGVMAGMMLRVRAFLYLGASFSLVAVLAMIWHAAANLGWTWLWYVTGIALGLTIILVFALFEKKRDDLMRLVEGLKAWEA
jgi:hypothetical protein